MSSIIDDTYDAYGTLDELAPFTDAIQTWDISAIDSIAPYLRPAYEGLLDVYSEMEQVLAKECKSDRLYFAKHEMKKLVSAYFKEAQWLDAGYIPKCEEHLENALVSSGCLMATTFSLVGMEEFIPKQTYEWLMNEPLIVRAFSMICRAMDDIIGHEVSITSQGQVTLLKNDERRRSKKRCHLSHCPSLFNKNNYF
uniref:Caryophyllene/alpha-humulene synthase n=1 Tax=Solanum tuberosum TaxID=4113 RepID=M1AZX2_SOLTU